MPTVRLDYALGKMLNRALIIAAATTFTSSFLENVVGGG